MDDRRTNCVEKQIDCRLKLFRQPWNKDISFAVAWESHGLPIYQGQINISSSSFCRLCFSLSVNFISHIFSTAFLSFFPSTKPASLIVRLLFEFASDSVSVSAKLNKNIKKVRSRGNCCYNAT